MLLWNFYDNVTLYIYNQIKDFVNEYRILS